MSDQDKKTLQILPINLDHQELLRPETLTTIPAQSLQQELPGTHSLQIILNDHIMTKLHSSGDLKDFTQKCLQQSCNILKPQVMPDIDGSRSEDIDEEEDAATQSPICYYKQTDSAQEIQNEAHSNDPLREIQSRMDIQNDIEDMRQTAKVSRQELGHFRNPETQSTRLKEIQYSNPSESLAGAKIDTDSQAAVLNHQNDNRLDSPSLFDKTDASGYNLKHTGGNSQEILSNSLSIKHFGKQNNINDIEKGQLMSPQNQDIILDESINNMQLFQDKNSRQSLTNKPAQLLGTRAAKIAHSGGKSQFAKLDSREAGVGQRKLNQQTVKRASSSRTVRTKLQLPSVTKIEEVIGLSKQNVIEHILTKKRDQKQSEKSDKNHTKVAQSNHTKNSKSMAVEKISKNEKLEGLNFPLQKLSAGELMKPAQLEMNNNSLIQLNQVLGLNSEQAMAKQLDQYALLSNLQHEMDLNKFLQQQLQMQEGVLGHGQDQNIASSADLIQSGFSNPAIINIQSQNQILAPTLKQSNGILPLPPFPSALSSLEQIQQLQERDKSKVYSEEQMNLQKSLTQMFEQQVQMIQHNNQSLGIPQNVPTTAQSFLENFANYGMLSHLNAICMDPNLINKQNLLQTLSKSSNSMDSLRLAILAQDNQVDNDSMLKSFNYHQLFNQQYISQQQNQLQTANQFKQPQQDNQVGPAQWQNQSTPSQQQNKPLLPPLNPYLSQMNPLNQQAQSQFPLQSQYQLQNTSFGGIGLTDSQLFATNNQPSLSDLNLKNQALGANSSFNNNFLNQLLSQSKSDLISQSIQNLSNAQQGANLTDKGIFKQLTLLEQWQMLSNLLQDPQAMESMNLDQLTLSQMQTKLLPEIQKCQNQLIQDYKQMSIQEGQTSLSFLPIINQDPYAFTGQVDFNKKRLVERIDEIDHEIIKNFTQKGTPSLQHTKSKASGSPRKDDGSREAKAEKKEKYLKRSKKDRERLLRRSQDKKKQFQKSRDRQEGSLSDRETISYTRNLHEKAKSGEIMSKQMMQYVESAANQKSMQTPLNKHPLGNDGASSMILSQKNLSATGNQKKLQNQKSHQSNPMRASIKTSNSTLGGLKTRNKQYKEYNSQTETESEDDDNIEDEDSEEKKYERKLNKLTKSEKGFTPQSSSNVLNSQQAASTNANESDLHHSKRPKRAGASTNRYFGYDQMASSKHDHSHYQLVSYLNYKSLALQPFIVYISVEAQLILNIHSHLSEYEVIGFLGGYCFESQTTNQKYLIISSVIPCDSLIENQVERQKNVDLCPISATNARQIIQSRGQQVLGWYHSHPFFPVEPSMIDIRNHAVYQKNFDLENLPFIALIIGPYSVKNRNETLMKVFHLVKEKQPYSLTYKQIPTKKLRSSLIQDLREIFSKYKTHKDKINMRDKWYAGQTREDKLISVIEAIMQKNLRTRDRLDLHNDLSNNLSQQDFQNFSTSNFVPKPKRQNFDINSRQSSGLLDRDKSEQSCNSDSEEWSMEGLLVPSGQERMNAGSLNNQSSAMQHGSSLSYNRISLTNHFSTGTTGTTLESNIGHSNMSVESLQLNHRSRIKENLSINSEENIEKLMHLIKVILKKELFEENYVSSEEEQ